VSSRRYTVGGIDVTDAVRTAVAQFRQVDEADDEIQTRLRDLFGPAIRAARSSGQRGGSPLSVPNVPEAA
jgi:hypothetical protein